MPLGMTTSWNLSPMQTNKRDIGKDFSLKKGENNPLQGSNSSLRGAPPVSWLLLGLLDMED
jgi:hypothetical protein